MPAPALSRRARSALHTLHTDHPRGYRTRAEWMRLQRAFARWPRFPIARSDQYTWASCLRCRRPYPSCSIRMCLDCLVRDGGTLPWGAELAAMHEGSFASDVVTWQYRR